MIVNAVTTMTVMRTPSEAASPKQRGGRERQENNRRRLQRILRNMMKNGLEFSARKAFDTVSFSSTPYRRVIE
jgi:hypothetical protein